MIAMNASSQRREKFYKIQREISNRSRPLNLVQDVRTRWNSTLQMMVRACRVRKDIKQYHFQHPEDLPSPLTDEEWRQVEYLVEILWPFQKFTNTIGGTKGPTIHFVFDVYNALHAHMESALNKLQRKKIPWKREMKRAIEKGREKIRSVLLTRTMFTTNTNAALFRQYYGKTQHALGTIYAIATVLSPGAKLRRFQDPEWRERNDENGKFWVRYCPPHRIY